MIILFDMSKSFFHRDGPRQRWPGALEVIRPMAMSPIVWVAAAGLFAASGMGAAFDPAATGYSGHKGVTLYVSKLGDNSDGSSWQKAFHTIEAALLTVPDAHGGHRVLIRPDTYGEANLYPAFKGAAGAYNLLCGDFDGQLGSGATGWVVIDSGATLAVVRTDPKAPTANPTFMTLGTGDPAQETGLKSVDWWGPWRCDPDHSGVVWDRWIYRHLYATGSEGGIGWDMTCEKGAQFSALVEDCVGIGRFAGACVIAHAPRAAEPVLFRRCYFFNLDWWGDAGGVYVRGESPSMPSEPHAVFEDCTIAGPDNALQAGYEGVDDMNTRVSFKSCRLIVLNFSQPHGTPSSGIICCGLKTGKQLRVDFEDCALMGYKVFGTRSGEVSYTVRGKVSAYVQYRQGVPAGFERERFWPVDVFAELMAPRFRSPVLPEAPPRLVKLPVNFGNAMENTPVIYRGKPLLVLNRRDDTKNKTDGYVTSMNLLVQDLATGNEVARFGEGHSFASAYVNGDELDVFASEGTNQDWFKSIYRFWTTDLKTWHREPAIALEGNEHLLNTSVCRDDRSYVMAYESDQPVQFCFKFARSADLAHWEKVPALVFTGVNREYSACPALRYCAPYYYAIYLHAAIPGHPGWVSFMARSPDLATWELSPLNPILEAGPGEGINNSDVDLFEWEGNTYVFYATGDQATWGSVRVAMFPGTMPRFFASYFPAALPKLTFSARQAGAR
jgi:hypothetical protein